MKKCKTVAAQKARRALNKVEDVHDLITLGYVANQLKEKIRRAQRDKAAALAFDAIKDEGLYVLRKGFMCHGSLLQGVVYRVSPYRKGRKHKGCWLVRASIERPRQRDNIWLNWTQSGDIVLAPEGVEDDAEKEKDDLEFRGTMHELFSR